MYLEISKPMDYHAALYIRLSKEDENEGPSQSVQNQESLLREFVQQHRLSVYDTYVDDGWSGTNFDRPAFPRITWSGISPSTECGTSPCWTASTLVWTPLPMISRPSVPS